MHDTHGIFKPGVHRPARAWFLEITLMRMSACVSVSMSVSVSVSVCPLPRLLETSGMICGVM